MAKTARVIGDIIHDSLAIEAGAFIEGNIKRLEGAGRTSTVSSASSPAASSSPGSGSSPAPANPLPSGGKSPVFLPQNGTRQHRAHLAAATVTTVTPTHRH